MVVNAWPNRKLLSYTLGMQFRDVMPTVLLCCVQACVMLCAGFLMDFVAKKSLLVADSGAEYLMFLAARLVLQGSLGILVFFILAYAFKLNPMGEYAHMAATAIGGRFPKIAKILEKRFGK